MDITGYVFAHVGGEPGPSEISSSALESQELKVVLPYAFPPLLF